MQEQVAAPLLSVPRRLFKYWLPVAVMLGLMYLLSTDVFSGPNTHKLIAFLTSWLGKDMKEPEVYEVNFAIRKFMHFFEYAVLAALLFRAFRAEERRWWKTSWAVYAFLMIVVWSLLDELHQSFTNLRDGSIYDSIIDSAGGLTALLLIWLYGRYKAKKEDSVF